MSLDMEGRCSCGEKSESTAGTALAQAFYSNGKTIYAKCSHGVVIVDDRVLSGDTFQFDECETQIYRITR